MKTRTTAGSLPNHRVYLFAAAVLFVLFSIKAEAIAQVYATDPGDFFDPPEFTANVGDVVYWTRENPTTNIHTVVADSTQGDYQGNKCYEPGGLNGYIYQVNIFYNHQFTVAQDCYYRCTMHPPSPGYPGMQGVIHVRNPAGAQPPSANTLTPMNIITAPGLPQAFTVSYSDPNGYLNIADASVHITDIAAGPNNEWAHYNPQTNSFTLTGAAGSCPPGASGALMTASMSLNCSSSSASGTGTNLSVTFNLTPQTSFSGPINSMFITVTDQSSASNGKIGGYWIVDRPPSADSITPVNISTSPGTAQSFTAGFSDPDGYLNISDAGLYLAAGPHNEWLHYSPTVNKFTLMGVSGSCSPGQATTLSNGAMTLNCAASSASGSGTTLTLIFNLTPLAPSAGKQFLQVPALIDSAGKTAGKILGTWTVLSF